MIRFRFDGLANASQPGQGHPVETGGTLASAAGRGKRIPSPPGGKLSIGLDADGRLNPALIATIGKARCEYIVAQTARLLASYRALVTRTLTHYSEGVHRDAAKLGSKI